MTWKVAGINFDHSHMGDLLRLCHEHPDVEIVGISHTDRERMQTAVGNFNIPDEQVFIDYPDMSGQYAAGHCHIVPVHGQPCRMGAEGLLHMMFMFCWKNRSRPIWTLPIK